jgi:hypothetical protein
VSDSLTVTEKQLGLDGDLTKTKSRLASVRASATSAPGGVTPYIRAYGYVPRMWVGFFAFLVFGWVDFLAFLVFG